MGQLTGCVANLHYEVAELSHSLGLEEVVLSLQKEVHKDRMAAFFKDEAKAKEFSEYVVSTSRQARRQQTPANRWCVLDSETGRLLSPGSNVTRSSFFALEKAGYHDLDEADSTMANLAVEQMEVLVATTCKKCLDYFLDGEHAEGNSCRRFRRRILERKARTRRASEAAHVPGPAPPPAGRKRTRRFESGTGSSSSSSSSGGAQTSSSSLDLDSAPTFHRSKLRERGQAETQPGYVAVWPFLRDGPQDTEEALALLCKDQDDLLGPLYRRLRDGETRRQASVRALTDSLGIPLGNRQLHYVDNYTVHLVLEAGGAPQSVRMVDLAFSCSPEDAARRHASSSTGDEPALAGAAPSPWRPFTDLKFEPLQGLPEEPLNTLAPGFFERLEEAKKAVFSVGRIHKLIDVNDSEFPVVPAGGLLRSLRAGGDRAVRRWWVATAVVTRLP